MDPSPLLATAKRAAAYFDRRDRKWTTVILHGEGTLSTVDRHPSEAEARAFIGMAGGSQDPYYAPPDGETGAVEVVMT